MSARWLRDPGMSDGTSPLGVRAKTGQLNKMRPLKRCADECDPRFLHSQPDGLRKDLQQLDSLGIWSPSPPSGAPGSIGDKAGSPSHADGALGQTMV